MSQHLGFDTNNPNESVSAKLDTNKRTSNDHRIGIIEKERGVASRDPSSIIGTAAKRCPRTPPSTCRVRGGLPVPRLPTSCRWCQVSLLQSEATGASRAAAVSQGRVAGDTDDGRHQCRSDPESITKRVPLPVLPPRRRLRC